MIINKIAISMHGGKSEMSLPHGAKVLSAKAGFFNNVDIYYLYNPINPCTDKYYIMILSSDVNTDKGISQYTFLDTVFMEWEDGSKSPFHVFIYKVRK